MTIKISLTKKFTTKNPCGQFIEELQGYCESNQLIENLNSLLPYNLNFLNLENKKEITEKDLKEINKILFYKCKDAINILNNFEKEWEMNPVIHTEQYEIKVEKKEP